MYFQINCGYSGVAGVSAQSQIHFLRVWSPQGLNCCGQSLGVQQVTRTLWALGKNCTITQREEVLSSNIDKIIDCAVVTSLDLRMNSNLLKVVLLVKEPVGCCASLEKNSPSTLKIKILQHHPCD